MTIDRNKLVCFVVGAKTADGAWHWGALNEDKSWLCALNLDQSVAAEKSGVFCSTPSEQLVSAALGGLGLAASEEVMAHRLFHPSDSDESASVLSRKVLR